MYINDKPCGGCAHYDPILRGKQGAGVVETSRGRCAKLSVYPHKEGPGQKFPPNVKRAANPEDLGEVVVRTKDEVVPGCKYWVQRKAAPTKAALVNKLKAK